MADRSDLPHVTTILKESGWIDTMWFTESARERGTNVHLACELLDEDDLDESSLTDDVRVRLEQYKRFKAETKYRVGEIEAKVFNERHGYQGRIDRFCWINGLPTILDLKAPGHFPWQGLQLAAYAHAWSIPCARYSLHLHDDKYKLVEWTDRQDWPKFLAALRKFYELKSNEVSA